MRLSGPRYRAMLLVVFVIALITGLAMGLAAALAAPTLRALLETPDLSDMAISPDGKTVVYRQVQASLVRNRSEATWWAARLDQNRVANKVADGGDVLLTDAGTVAPEVPQWSPDSAWIYFRALVDGAVGVWRARRDGAATEPVTHDDADIQSFRLSSDGRSLRYVVGATRTAILDAEAKEHDDGVRLDATIDPGQALERGAVINGRLATQRLAGAWFGRSGLLADQPRREKVIDLATLALEPTERPWLPPSNPGGLSVYQRAAVSPDGRWRAEANWDGRRARLVAHRSGGADVPCSAASCQGDRISALVWRPSSNTLMFTTVDPARRNALYLWDVESDVVKPLYKGTGVVNGGDAEAPCAVGARVAACVEASALSPPQLIAIDLETAKARTIADPGVTLASDQDLSVETEVWRDGEGHPFVGQLLRPRGTHGPLPLVINYYHCDGYLRGGYGNEWPLAPLAAAGIATLCIEMAPLADGPQDGLAMYRTAEAGIGVILDRLAAQGIIDPKRVGMGGLSFGSEVTMFLAMHSDRLTCLSIASPQISPVYYEMNGVQGRDNHKILKAVWGLGTPEETPARWKLLSPALNVEAFRAPLLMQLSEQEYRWDMDFLSRLSFSSTPSEVWLFPDEMHQKAEPRHRLAVYERNLDWFRYWLQGYVDPDPLKADQYRRWTAKAKAAEITPGLGQRTPSPLQDRTQVSTSAH